MVAQSYAPNEGPSPRRAWIRSWDHRSKMLQEVHRQRRVYQNVFAGVAEHRRRDRTALRGADTGYMPHEVLAKEMRSPRVLMADASHRLQDDRLRRLTIQGSGDFALRIASELHEVRACEGEARANGPIVVCMDRGWL